MGVFQTPKQFLPGVDRAPARTTPALPAKSLVCSGCSLASAVAASFAHAKLGRASRATRDLARRLRLATNFLQKRTRAFFLSGLQSPYKIPAGKAQRDFLVLSGHRPRRAKPRGILLSLRVILAYARLTRPRTAWEFAKLPFCSAKPRFLQLGERGATRFSPELTER